MKIQSKHERNKSNGIITFYLPIRNESSGDILTGYGKFSAKEKQDENDDEIEYSDFKRADLIFYGVNNMDESYEVNVFLNTPEADSSTKPDEKNGFAGNFSIFGHGGCYGGYGHCETPTFKGKYDPRIEHPSSKPNTIIVEVTNQLKRVIKSGRDPKGMLVTLVPSCPHLKESEEAAAESFRKPKKIELAFYN